MFRFELMSGYDSTRNLNSDTWYYGFIRFGAFKYNPIFNNYHSSQWFPVLPDIGICPYVARASVFKILATLMISFDLQFRIAVTCGLTIWCNTVFLCIWCDILFRFTVHIRYDTLRFNMVFRFNSEMFDIWHSDLIWFSSSVLYLIL